MPNQEYFSVVWRIPPVAGSSADTITPRMRGAPWRPYSQGTFVHGIVVERVNPAANGIFSVIMHNETDPRMFPEIQLGPGVTLLSTAYVPPKQLPFGNLMGVPGNPGAFFLGSSGVYPKLYASGTVRGRELAITMYMTFGA